MEEHPWLYIPAELALLAGTIIAYFINRRNRKRRVVPLDTITEPDAPGPQHTEFMVQLEGPRITYHSGSVQLDQLTGKLTDFRDVAAGNGPGVERRKTGKDIR